jgi:MOSC domain-containing protein YiiM
MAEKGWVKRFTERGAPGAYLRVLVPGEIRAGDPVEVVHVPGHGVTIGMVFGALMGQRDLLTQLLAAEDDLPGETRDWVRRKLAVATG